MRAMAITRFHLLTIPIAAASLALAACGGDGNSTASSGDDRAEFREAALEYAECMRRNGVDMPDPTFQGNGGILFRDQQSPAEEPAFERAEEECRKHLEDARPPEPSEEQQREVRERALRFAQCMREHGIDVPDPTFDDDGSIQQSLGRSINPRDPAFQEAQKACERFLPPVEEGS
jgi:hypothetical protein